MNGAQATLSTSRRKDSESSHGNRYQYDESSLEPMKFCHQSSTSLPFAKNFTHLRNFVPGAKIYTGIADHFAMMSRKQRAMLVCAYPLSGSRVLWDHTAIHQIIPTL